MPDYSGRGGLTLILGVPLLVGLYLFCWVVYELLRWVL